LKIRRNLLHLLPALSLLAGAGGVVALSGPPAGAATAPAGAIARHAAAPPAAGRASGVADGYWLATADGSVFAAGPARSLGGTGTTSANPVVGIASTHNGTGYWLVEADGNVLPFGSARSHGNLPAIGTHVDDIVAIAPTGDDGGYWLIGRDGGEFAFGDARYHGSLPGLHIHVTNIVGMVATSDGGGYWLVGSDGGVFAFGNARYRGSLPNIHVHVTDIRAMIPSPTRNGYILVGSDGGTFVFGTGVTYLGSLPGRGIRVNDIVGLALTGDAAGYWLAGANAATYAFGDARAYATPAGITSHLPVVAIATAPPPIADTSTAAWVLQKTPAIGSQLNGVKCLSVNNCWAVGWDGTGDPTTHSDFPLAEHWNGSSWSQTVLPHPKTRSPSSTLNGISCPATNFCMAVGAYSPDLVTFLPLAETWSGGTTWTPSFPPFATSSGTSTEYTGVSCTAFNSCLAVGYYYGTNSGSALGLISAKWNGSSWAAGRPVNPVGTSPQLHGVSCASPNACFAVGNFSTTAEVNLIEFWNGSTWSVQKSDEPGGASASSLSAVACVTSADCAAVGDFVGATGPQTTLAENWNGKAWAVQPTPGVKGAISSVLTGVSCPFSTDCVAVGSYTNAFHAALTTAEAWNGQSWAAETTLSPSGSKASFLNAASCGSITFCTAVGNYTTSGSTTQALAEQWQLHVGTYMSLTPAANPAVTGQGLVVTAGVVPTESGFGNPAGTVTFTVTDRNGTKLSCAGGNAVVLRNGTAACSVPTGQLSPLLSPYKVTAAFAAAAPFKPAAASLNEAVVRDPANVVVSSNANPSAYTEPIGGFTATVTAKAPGVGQPAGTVTFTINNGQERCEGGVSTFPLNSKDQAFCPMQKIRLPPGKYTVIATYNGSSYFAPSDNTKNPFVQQVVTDPTSTSLTSSTSTPFSGQRVTFIAVVTGKAPGQGTVFGNVAFTQDGAALNCNGSGSDVEPIMWDTNSQPNQYDARCLAPVVTQSQPATVTITATYTDPSPGWGSSSASLNLPVHAG
jgi:hypothetical protein